MRLRLSRASSCLRRHLISSMTPARATSRLNLCSSSSPSTSSSPASTFALWYLGLADGGAGAEAEEAERREVVGGDRRGKETKVALVSARRRLGVGGEMIPAVAAAAAARMVVVAGDGDAVTQRLVGYLGLSLGS